jgi:16S rRNA processing protein RimM
LKSKLVGKIKAPHGLRGELFVIIFSRELSWLNRLKACEIRNPKTGETQELQIKSAKIHKDGFILSTPQVVDRNHSEAITGFEFLIPEDLLQSKKGETIYLNEILGFDVLLSEQCVGQVESFGSNGPQDLLVIRNEEHLFEVPFVTHYIESIDFDGKKIHMNFPSDLIDINRK